MALRSGIRAFRARHAGALRLSGLLALFFFSFGSGFAYASWAMVCRSGRCPSIEVLDEYQPRQTSKLFAIDGRFVAELGLERRTLIRLADVPQTVQDAFIFTEDKRFYRHSGVDWQSVPRALIADIRAGRWVEGFSTITMQLARNIFPERISREKALIRKLKEIKVARAIESRYTKERILELYLNQIYFGNGAYGIETAAQRYFGKSARELNTVEGATLAAIPKSPTRYNPRRYPAEAVQRRNTILELMHRNGVLSTADASLAKAHPLRLAPRTESGEVAPYFVEHVRQQLDDRFGAQLYEQGLNVYTTIDIDMQAAAERALERQLSAIENGAHGPYRWQSHERYIARAGNREQAPANAPYLQGSIVAVDPRTGGIRALVGGRDFDDNQFNRATQALRQPGSTFKPIVYADAIQKGRPLSYLLDDSQLEVAMGDGSTWRPQNFDGRSDGRVPLRVALYRSRNIATIRLGMELGEQSVIDMARKFGLTTPIPPYPSIHIGAAEVYPLELVTAYGAFATLGNRTTPQAIVRVETAKGEVLWEPVPVQLPVMSREEAWLMVSAMKDVVRRGTAANAVGSHVRFPAAGKTGTTNDGSDVWFIGFTSDLVAGVWIGFDKPQRIKASAQGGTLAGPAWASFMNEVYRRRRAPIDWPTPINIVARQIDVGTNQIASAYCPTDVVATEYFIPGTDPIYSCDVHTEFNYFRDTLAYPPGTYPPGTYPPGTYPPGTYPPGTYPPGTYPPGVTPPVDTFGRTPPRGGVTPPRDTIRRPDTSLQQTVFPRRDSLGRIIPDTTVRPPDTTGRRPPDTTGRRPPDTTSVDARRPDPRPPRDMPD